VERTRKYGWKMWILVIGILSFLFLVGAILPTKANAQIEALELATPSIPVIQPTPTVDATVTALNKQKLREDVEQEQHTSGNWWWNNAVALFSPLALGLAGAFTLLRYLRDQRNELKKQREERQAALERRAEERFQSAVEGLGSEREGAQIGAAILLRTFLRSGYEQFYTQTFDLAVANLRRRGISKTMQHQLWEPPQNLDIALPLTTLNQALIVVFKEAFPLSRDREKKEPASFDATGIQLDNAYLVSADLKQFWGPQAFLRGAKLTEADLTRANLRGANLRGANLSGADLSGAYLFGAYLFGPISLRPISL
jgi:Pentapeptide repeats (8 copies)